MMNAGNLPGIFRFLLCLTVLYSMLAWCSDIAAQRPYVPPSELPAVLQSTPEEVALGDTIPLGSANKTPGRLFSSSQIAPMSAPGGNLSL